MNSTHTNDNQNIIKDVYEDLSRHYRNNENYLSGRTYSECYLKKSSSYYHAMLCESGTVKNPSAQTLLNLFHSLQEKQKKDWREEWREIYARLADKTFQAILAY
jgi:hypothetical protein